MSSHQTFTNMREARLALGYSTGEVARQRLGITERYYKTLEEQQSAGEPMSCSDRTKYEIESELHLEPGCLTGNPEYRPQILPLRRASAYPDREMPVIRSQQEINPQVYDTWRTGGAINL